MVAEKLVASLARPGGNTTGISLLSPELDGKRQEILMEAVPSARRIAALADSNTTPAKHLRTLQDAARSRGVTLSIFAISKAEEISSTIDKAKASGVEALNVLATPLFFVNQRTIIDRTAALRLPAIYQWPHMAEQGGLLAYGPRFDEVHRQRARMVIKILRGTKPVDIPVEQPTKFNLVLNGKTAKALGLAIPPTLLARADEVIE
jgi:putative ABC transport system substrate-binding protein